MPRLKKTKLTLPDEVVAAFNSMDSGDERRDKYVMALRAQQWTLQSIASAAGVSRERIRQITRSNTEYSTADLAGLPLVTPPLIPDKMPKVYREPSPATLARLLELQPYAEKVRSNSPAFREEAEEYTKLINHAYVNEGVPIYRIAMRLSRTSGAVRFRLIRYGYLSTKTASNSKVYSPIKSSNRAI